MNASVLLRALVLGLPFLAMAMPSAHAGATPQRTYEASYRVTLVPASRTAHVALALKGDMLPSRLTFSIEPERHRGFTADGKLETGSDTVVWYPPRNGGTLSYDFHVDRRLASGSYDSRMTEDWAIFRGDRLVPRVSVRAVRDLSARATLEFRLPEGWSVVTPYEERGNHRFEIADPQRRFDRPAGWILAGRVGSRHQNIAGISNVVAAPLGDDARRQDTLAFLAWNLPHLVSVFPEFPRRLLVVRAGDPMFRGGLSGPGSLFLHSDRPLISENRTSTLLHELVHVAMGIRGDEESDWITEGFAEYYSIQTLRRSGGISQGRFRDAMERQEDWARRAPNLFVGQSTGAVTARAVTVLAAVDAEIRAATGSRASLDDVARELAQRRGTVSLEELQSVAQQVAGRPVAALERPRLQSRR